MKTTEFVGTLRNQQGHSRFPIGVFVAFYGWTVGAAWAGGYAAELLGLEAFQAMFGRSVITFTLSLITQGTMEWWGRRRFRFANTITPHLVQPCPA